MNIPAMIRVTHVVRSWKDADEWSDVETEMLLALDRVHHIEQGTGVCAITMTMGLNQGMKTFHVKQPLHEIILQIENLRRL